MIHKLEDFNDWKEMKNCIIHADALELMKKIPDNSISLVIADPPYYKIKGEFDFIYKSFEEYLSFVELWAIELKRILSESGTIYWFGDEKNIAYSQIIFDKYFGLLNSLVWEKAEADGLFGSTGSALLRSYPISTERILMYEKRHQKTGGEIVFEELLKPNSPFSKYLKDEFGKAEITNKKISELFLSKTGNTTGCVSNWLNGNNVITEEQYLKIRKFLNNKYLRKEYEDLRKEYEDLRKEYEDLRRPFNNIYKSTEVIKVRFSPSKFKHDTVKPLNLISRLIETSSYKKSLVLDPFGGSFTTMKACQELGIDCISCDLEEVYCEIGEKRLSEVPLFSV